MMEIRASWSSQNSRPGTAGHFGTQAFRAPIDCEAISFLPFAAVVGSSILRGLASAATIGRSLNSHIPAITCKDRPSNPRQLVCQGYGHDVAMCSRKQSLNPPAERRILLGKTRESRARTVDQQHPQITLAALADAQQPRFSTCRRLARDPNQAAKSRPQLNV
jgi:hypothetical protein